MAHIYKAIYIYLPCISRTPHGIGTGVKFVALGKGVLLVSVPANRTSLDLNFGVAEGVGNCVSVFVDLSCSSGTFNECSDLFVWPNWSAVLRGYSWLSAWAFRQYQGWHTVPVVLACKECTAAQTLWFWATLICYKILECDAFHSCTSSSLIDIRPLQS